MVKRCVPMNLGRRTDEGVRPYVVVAPRRKIVT